MANRHLTNLYRPQTFAQVLGQEYPCRILSRAATSGKLAPAYMLSGTRGVGKTTLARILAKAINCRQGPAEEPCNECRSCKQITQGAAVDVMEVDAASHTGVDNVRRLTEEIGYSPVEGRYKVVIIDEAHMLSRSAFNALLKTLEEPPPHALFILATTEPHKFPPTIVSRCQHFALKRLPSSELENHLQRILDRESLSYDPKALSLLVRKSGGSVRDSLSLLSQISSLGEEIRLDKVREILGVAGSEILQELMGAILQRDCAGLVSIARRLLDQGLDIGYFLQELTQAWRNMFLLKETGEKGAYVLDIPEDEAKAWSGWSGEFSLSFLHAAWQMCLEEQRRILTSTDPALALELLLLNLAYLPSLVSVQELKGGASGEGSYSGESSSSGYQSAGSTQDDEVLPDRGDKEKEGLEAQSSGRNAADWEGFLRFLEQKEVSGLPGFRLSRAEIGEDKITVTCPNFLARRMEDFERYNRILELAGQYFGRRMELEFFCSTKAPPENGNLKEKVMNDPAVQSVLQEFGAKVVEVRKR